jgi:hypothetical protein
MKPPPYAVRFLLDELCEKYGFCSASSAEAKFCMLVTAGPIAFTRELFSVEGLDPAADRALAKRLEAHVVAAFDRWESRV